MVNILHKVNGDDDDIIKLLVPFLVSNIES
jgi:hypothetical protein